jgi:hypothetical protein
VKRTIALAWRRSRGLLAVAVLLVPVALVAPGYLRGEVQRANGDHSVFTRPFGVTQREYNQALAVGVVRHVPAHASVGTVGAHLAAYGTRWFAYVIALRQLTDAQEKWTIVFGETPRQAHLDPVRSWQYGADWLVER